MPVFASFGQADVTRRQRAVPESFCGACQHNAKRLGLVWLAYLVGMHPQPIPGSLRGVSFNEKCVLVRHTCIYEYLLYSLETGIAQAGYTLFYLAVFRAMLPANLQLAWFKWSLPVHCLPMN